MIASIIPPRVSSLRHRGAAFLQSLRTPTFPKLPVLTLPSLPTLSSSMSGLLSSRLTSWASNSRRKRDTSHDLESHRAPTTRTRNGPANKFSSSASQSGQEYPLRSRNMVFWAPNTPLNNNSNDDKHKLQPSSQYSHFTSDSHTDTHTLGRSIPKPSFPSPAAAAQLPDQTLRVDRNRPLLDAAAMPDHQIPARIQPQPLGGRRHGKSTSVIISSPSRSPWPRGTHQASSSSPPTRAKTLRQPVSGFSKHRRDLLQQRQQKAQFQQQQRRQQYGHENLNSLGNHQQQQQHGSQSTPSRTLHSRQQQLYERHPGDHQPGRQQARRQGETKIWITPRPEAHSAARESPAAWSHRSACPAPLFAGRMGSGGGGNRLETFQEHHSHLPVPFSEPHAQTNESAAYIHGRPGYHTAAIGDNRTIHAQTRTLTTGSSFYNSSSSSAEYGNQDEDTETAAPNTIHQSRSTRGHGQATAVPLIFASASLVNIGGGGGD